MWGGRRRPADEQAGDVRGPRRDGVGHPHRPPPLRDHYDRGVLGLLLVVVVGIVWLRRRWVVRRERAHQAEWVRAEAEAVAREREIIEDLEARFHQ